MTVQVQITMLQRVRCPRGRRFTIRGASWDDAAQKLGAFLQKVKRYNQLWAGAVFRNDYRSNDNFIEADLITVDADFTLQGKRAAAPPDVEQALVHGMVTGKLGATIGHLTPRGARLILVLSNPAISILDRKRAGLGAAQVLSRDLDALGLLLDGDRSGYAIDGCTEKAAQPMFLPNFCAFGKERCAKVIVIPGPGGGAQVFDPVALIQLAPAVRTPTDKVSSTYRASAPHSEFARAVDEFNERQPIRFTEHGRTCPACGHHDCFNELPGSGGRRWFCHSTNHESDSHLGPEGTPCGIRTQNGWMGDSLDLVAHAEGKARHEVLRDAGLLPIAATRTGRTVLNLGCCRQ